MSKVTTILFKGLSVFGGVCLILIMVGLIFLNPFSCNDEPKKIKCADKIKPDTTQIKLVYGEEDFAQFHSTFIDSYNFQLSRVKFPVQGITTNNAWAGKELNPCNWRNLLKYYNDTSSYTVRMDTTETFNKKHEYVYMKGKDFKPFIEISYELGDNKKWYLIECLYH